MVQQQKGFHVLYVLLLIAVLGVIGFAGYTVMHAHSSNSSNHDTAPTQPASAGSSQAGTGPNYTALASCGSNKAVLTTVPVDTSKFYQLMPLGNQGVPDHTMPADHLYFAFITPGETAALSSPGKIVVTNITLSGEVINGQSSHANDYEITFAACKGVNFDFAHIGSLAAALQAVAPKDNDSSCSHGSQATGVQTFYCNKDVDLAMQPGEPIGTVGEPNLGAFDFGAHDSSYKDPGYVDSNWHVDQTAVCGLDYFTPNAQAQLYALVKRTAEPRCGQIGQDKANTLQGDWFATNDHSNALTEWNKHLSIVHNNVDPTVGELAVGGTLGNPAIYLFNPAHSGATNREPGETTAGKIYCYQNETTSVQNNQPGSGKILMQLTSNHAMKAEYKTGACTSNEAFVNPTAYYR